MHRKRGHKKKEDRRAVCLLWIICVGSVCVFQLWIVDYAKNSWACLSVSVSLLCLSAGEDCKLLSEVENSASDRPVTNLLSTPPQPRLTGLQRSQVCSSKTYTLQQQRAGCDLAAIKQLHPSWSLCSSNPLHCPSPWQSCTHVTAPVVDTYTHMHVC